MNNSSNTTKIKTFLVNTGKLIYGSRWKTRFAKDLGLKNGKSLTELLESDSKVPQSVVDKCYSLLKCRKSAADELASELLSRVDKLDDSIIELDSIVYDVSYNLAEKREIA